MSDDDVRHDVYYPYPPRRIWEALTNSTDLAAWLMPNDFRPIVGHRFSFWAELEHGWSGTVDCEVVEVDAPYRLAYTWWSDPTLPTTLVTWRLEPVDGGTYLHLTHRRQAPKGQKNMSRFFRLQVDEVALADELFAFVTDHSGTRSTRPVVTELHELNPEMIEVLESMVLDGVDRREYVDEYIHAVVGRFTGWGFNSE